MWLHLNCAALSNWETGCCSNDAETKLSSSSGKHTESHHRQLKPIGVFHFETPIRRWRHCVNDLTKHFHIFLTLFARIQCFYLCGFLKMHLKKKKNPDFMSFLTVYTTRPEPGFNLDLLKMPLYADRMCKFISKFRKWDRG